MLKLKGKKYQAGGENPLSPFNSFKTAPTSIAAPILNNGPQAQTLQSKAVPDFQLNYNHIAESNFVKGIAAYLANKKNNQDQINYQQAQSNPLLQLPGNPNVTQQSLYGQPQFQQGGYKYVGYTDPNNVNNKMIIDATNQGGKMDASGKRSKGTYNYKTPDGKMGIIDQTRLDEILKQIGAQGKLNNNILYSQSMNYGDVAPYTEFASGGLTANKAKEMLKDGTAHGKKLTSKQKHWFGMVGAGKGKYQDGGSVDPFEAEFEKGLFEEDRAPVDTPEPQDIVQPEVQEEEPVIQQPDYSNDNFSLTENYDTPDYNTEDDGSAQGAGQSIQPAVSSAPSERPALDVEAFKKGIAAVETPGSKNPYLQQNHIDPKTGKPYSSAYGKYQIIKDTRQGIRARHFPELSPEQFERAYKDPNFQERVMNKFSKELLDKHGDPQKAAIAFFLGSGKVDKINDLNYRPTPNNATVGEYLGKFNKGYKFQTGGLTGGTNFKSQADPRLRGYDLFNNIISNNLDPSKSVDSIDGKTSALDTFTGALGEKDARTLYTSAQIFNQNSKYAAMKPEQRLQSFYSSISQNPELEALKQKIRTYSGTGNAQDLQNTSPLLAIKKQGGLYKEGGEYEVSEEEYHNLIKQGYEINPI